MEGRRKQYPSCAQKSRLVALLEEDAQLRAGKFSSSFTKKQGIAKWKIIAQEVNSIPGTKKTWQEWRKAWQDMKTRTKKKASSVKRTSQLTGGGPPPKQLNELEEIVLTTISDSAVSGHQNLRQQSINIAEKFAKSLDDKNLTKSTFYKEYLGQQEKQTIAMTEAVSKLADAMLQQAAASNKLAEAIAEQSKALSAICKTYMVAKNPYI